MWVNGPGQPFCDMSKKAERAEQRWMNPTIN